MKAVITHTDLRIYWPARIKALRNALSERGDDLYTIEIAGAGSPYAFAGRFAGRHSPSDGLRDAFPENWICLFPEARMEDIPVKEASRRLLAMLDELNPDVVMSGSFAYPSGAAAVYWAKTRRKAVVIFDDARPADVPRNGLVNYIKQRLYDQVDAMLCPAEPWREAMRQWRLKPEQIFLGVDVVDNDFWQQQSATELPDERRTSVAGIPLPEKPYLLAVGRQIAVKNFLFLLQVYRRYCLEQPGYLPLVFVGEGPEREMMEAYIKEEKLSDVHLLPFADPKTLRQIYRHAAALVLPSSSETWGLVVNEAMAAGLPILISSACGCASVLVQEGVNGYVFPPDDDNRLLAVLKSFTNLPAKEVIAMGDASAKQIADWGLNRFTQGSIAAMEYALQNRKECRSLLERALLRRWKGRYQPV